MLLRVHLLLSARAPLSTLHGVAICMAWRPLAHTRRVVAVAPALLGSLVLVALIRKAETANASPAYIIGYLLSDFLAEGFLAISALLGALGSFFSGSTTVSNLTFGVIQQVRAPLWGRASWHVHAVRLPLTFRARRTCGTHASHRDCSGEYCAGRQRSEDPHPIGKFWRAGGSAWNRC